MMFAETACLRIRGYREFDLDHLVATFSDPRKRRGDPEAVMPESETKWRTALPAIVAKRLMFCILETKESDYWAGYASLWAEGASKNRTVMFSIALNGEQEGTGYGTEATRWIVDYAFMQLGIHRISLEVLADNLGAIAMYKKSGFVEEGRAREANFQDGKWWDGIHMSIIESEWVPSTVR